MKSTANQSNNSGWVGNSPCKPKSPEDFTSPLPNISCQIKFTNTRAVSGFFLLVVHLAKPKRLLPYFVLS